MEISTRSQRKRKKKDKIFPKLRYTPELIHLGYKFERDFICKTYEIKNKLKHN